MLQQMRLYPRLNAVNNNTLIQLFNLQAGVLRSGSADRGAPETLQKESSFQRAKTPRLMEVGLHQIALIRTLSTIISQSPLEWEI
jgi:hypothetical protein